MDLLRSNARGPRALVLDGALTDGADVDAVASSVADELERLGLHAQRVTLRDVQVAPCLGCFECWTLTPGVCKTKDAGRDLARAYVRSHLVAFVTPVTFGGFSSELKKAVDRMLCIELPFFTRVGGEVRHRPRYPRRPALLAIGVLRAPSAAQERIFHELVRRNAANLQATAFASHVLVRPRDAPDTVETDLRGVIAGVLEASGAHAGSVAPRGGAR